MTLFEAVEHNYKALTEGLSFERQRLLLFVTFRVSVNDNDLMTFAKKYGYKQSEVNKLKDFLEDLGFLDEGYYDYWRTCWYIHAEYFFTLALHLLMHESDMLAQFKSMPFKRNPEDKLMWDVAESLVKGDMSAVQTELRNGRLPDDMDEYLRPYASFPEFDPVLLSLPVEEFRKQLLYSLDHCMSEADAPDNILDMVKHRLDNYEDGLFGKLPALEGVYDYIELIRYFRDGTPMKTPRDHQSLYSFIYDAFRQLYAGNVDDSLDAFRQALKIRNQFSKDKNLFTDPLWCFYLILAYKKADTEDTKKKVQQFLNKKAIEDNPELRPAAVLAECVGSVVDEKYRERTLGYLGRMSKSNASVWLTAMLFGYFGYPLEIEENGKVVPLPRPRFAIFRHELSPWMESIPVEEKGELRKTFGGAPLLASILLQEKWEIVLKEMKDMLEAKDGTGQSSAAMQSERIAYFVLRGGTEVEYRVQKRLKSGSWSAGKQVSLSDFYGQSLSCMDERDRLISAKARSRYTHYVRVEDAFPHLIGTDRVYTGNYAPYHPVTITEEKPFVEVKMVKGNYKVTSNAVPQDRNRGRFLSRTVVRKIDETHYAVVQLNEIQHKLLSSIMSLTGLPERSQEMLRQLLPLLSKHIEIHSELMDGGSSLESRDGDATVLLQLRQSGEDFIMRAVVRPLSDGKLTFLPAEGDSVIYDEANGVRYQVKRNLKEERNSAALLTGFIESFYETDVFELSEILFTPEEMLALIEWVNEHSDRFAIEWPQGRKVKVHPQISQGGINVNVVSRENWFEVEGDVTYGDAHIDIETLLSLISSGAMQGRYVRLGEDEYVALADSLRKHLKRLASITESGRGGAHISAFNVGPLAELVKGDKLGIKADDGMTALMTKVKEASALEPEIPSALNATLRDYQYDGFRWMVRLDHWGAGACLADDMGLGKTVQTIAFLLHKASKGPSLVVAPASVVLNWSKELERFAPSLNVHVLNHAQDRKSLLSSLVPFDVVLTTYGLLPQEDDSLSRIRWNVVCLDEAHTIKNRQTKMSASAMKLQSDSRVILTGTPIQNYLGELWNLFQFLNPGLLGTFEQFSRKYISTADADLASLKKILQPFILRRTKAQVIEELPDKTDIIYPVELSDVEMMTYETMRERVEQSLGNESRINVNALAEITRLRQAACSISLVNQNWNQPSSKVNAFVELVSDICSGDNRVLVFSQFTSFLSCITGALDEIGLEYFYLDGSTPIRKRNKMVQDFQSGMKQIFIVSLKAGGLGLNLTGANYVIHLDPWWNPAIEQQATDRAYRIGQKQNVTVYHLISQHTIEEKILRLHKTKRDLADTFLEGADVARSLTLDDLRQLVEG